MKKKHDYQCPSCNGRLAEEGTNSVGVTCLACVKCGRIAGVAYEVPDHTSQIEGQTTIEEFLE